MKYRDLMGFSKPKKKITKKQSTPKTFILENWSQYPVVEGHRPYQQQDRADPSNLNQVAAGIIGGTYYYTNANTDREGDM